MKSRRQSLPGFTVLVTVGLFLGRDAPVQADFLAASSIGDEIVQFDDSGARVGSFVFPGSGGLNAPFSMAWGPEGNLYVGGDYDPGSPNGKSAVFVYDGRSGAFIRRVDFAPRGYLYGLHFTDNGDLLISVPNGPGYGGGVYRIDPATGQVRAVISGPPMDTPGKPFALPDGRVVVGNCGGYYSGDNKILVLDLNSSSIAGVFAQGTGLRSPFGMGLGPDGIIYAANLYGPNAGIARIDPGTGAMLGNLTIPGGNASMSDVLFTRDGRLWASDIIHGTFYEFDAGSGAYLGTVQGVPICYDLLHMPEPTGMAIMSVGCALLLVRRSRAACHQ